MTARTNGYALALEKRVMLARLRKEVRNERVLAAIERVPREWFVPRELRHAAYQDSALPIGHDQTISQPLIVALMTAALDPQPADKVLEIGTGSGYQAAVLAELAENVVTVERIPELARAAGDTLRAIGYRSRIAVRQAGNQLGFPQEAPFDGILVTAAAPKVPACLLAQLAPGGRLVIPVGSREDQELLKVVNHANGPRISWYGGCRFVPLLGPDGWLTG